MVKFALRPLNQNNQTVDPIHFGQIEPSLVVAMPFTVVAYSYS